MISLRNALFQIMQENIEKKLLLFLQKRAVFQSFLWLLLIFGMYIEISSQNSIFQIDSTQPDREGFINFTKQQAIAGVLHQLQRFKCEYHFKEDAKISAYIQTFKGFDKETAFQMSKIVESTESVTEETVVE